MPRKQVVALALCAVALAGCDDKKQATKPTAATDDGKAQAMALVRRYAAWGAAPAGGTPAGTDEAGLLASNYYMVFDGSGSMADPGCSGGAAGGRIVPARLAAIRFERGLPQDVNLGLFVFDAHGRGERVPMGRGPDNRAAFEREVMAVEAGNATPLGAALSTGLERMRERAVMQRGYGGYHIVVETDGQATDGTAMPEAVERIGHTPVVLETIGFCIDGGHPLNQPGRTIYREARDPASLASGLDTILAEGAREATDDTPATDTPR